MKKYAKIICIRIYWLRFILYFLVISQNNCFADCSCSIGSNGINVIGLEYTANTCPLETFSDDSSYIFIVNAMKCNGSSLVSYASYGDTYATPKQLMNYLVANGYRVLRNTSGTRIIAVQNGRYPFSGNISGMSMAGLAAGVYYTNPVTLMDSFCTGSTTPDTNGNGVPDCLEQPVLDLPLNLGPPPCLPPTQRNGGK